MLALHSALASVLLTGCSSLDSQPAEPSTAAPPPAALEAPSVEQPLNAVGLNSCATLDSVQLQHLGLDERSATDYSTNIATGCAWTANSGAFLATVGLRTDAGVQLAYDIQDSFPAFVVAEIEGYPAVYLDQADAITCRFWTGVADDQSFIAEVRSLDFTAPPLCEKAEALASEVIDALRERS
ncbi:DUF3558 family protein [Pseudonocardia sp. RS010]|uniref:DUF3558 family protein n=1 Tax=Pseudonocardia sp. RS010 TaxID=3385979 RepID=UPI0039A22C94